MKRVGNLYEKIYSLENLKLADKNARKGKSKQKGVKLFDLNKEDNLINLHHILLNKEYKTSEYKVFKLFDGKEREIFQLPYYPDRITHHAVLNVIGDIFLKSFTKNTYSCIKKRGIHKCLADLKTALKDVDNTTYCLKIDIKKFYPSIKNEILKSLLRKKFKDEDLLYLLDEIIDSNKQGLPIGNFASQILANFYLTYFDHYLKEKLKINYTMRYCDDIIILGKDKEDLRGKLINIIDYLKDNLKLELSNYQIFPVESRGIDFVGYVSYHHKTRLRKSIKKRFINMIKYNNNIKSKASYNGWLTHGNCINLQNKYMIDGGF
jgi:RNA-directed DNA polymerase